MFVDGPVLLDRQQTDREDQNSHRLTMQNLEKYTDMLSRLKKADEFSPHKKADFDERRSNSSSSSARRKNL
jgi:hypothetical protein